MRPILLLVVVASSSVPGQVQWQKVGGRAFHAMAYDQTRGRLVLAGGLGGAGGVLSDTWERDNAGNWIQAATSFAGGPSGLTGHAMAAIGSGRVISFGGTRGIGIPIAPEMMEWDGNYWTFEGAAGPGPRVHHAMAFDSARNVVVLFGGWDGTNLLGDTWEWDVPARRWTQLVVSNGPGPRYGHAMAYDSARHVVLMVNGANAVAGNSASILDEFWKWDGTAWTTYNQSGGGGGGGAPIGTPQRSWRGALAFDPVRARAVLFGGFSRTPGGNTGSPLAGTFEWDGSQWTNPHNLPQEPMPRGGHAMSFDGGPGRIALQGGSENVSGLAVLSDTWEWEGSTWIQSSASTLPLARSEHSMAYDSMRRVSVLYGGSSSGTGQDTWEWDGERWAQRQVPGPAAQYQGAMVFDSSRNECVFFGGSAPGALNYSQTWTWNGTNWISRLPGRSPPALDDHAMAFDSIRSRVVLFGGYSAASAGVRRDTWEWDGAAMNWTDVTPRAGGMNGSPSPPARRGHAMAFDERRGVAVLFGGGAPGLPGYTDTWEWNGSRWTQRQPLTSPASAGPMVFDRTRARMVMTSSSGGTWEWDGTNWTQRFPATSPSARGGHAMVFDSFRGKVVLFGGSVGGGGISNETWEYSPVNPARFTAFGTGCPGTAGIPTLAAGPFQLPWIGDTFELTLAPVVPATFSLLVLGVSNTQWGTAPLPLDLTGVGFTGCFLRASLDLLRPAANTGGTASFPVAIPNDPALVGGALHTQGLGIDPAANPGGIAFSNGGTAVIGAR